MASGGSSCHWKTEHIHFSLSQIFIHDLQKVDHCKKRGLSPPDGESLDKVNGDELNLCSPVFHIHDDRGSQLQEFNKLNKPSSINVSLCPAGFLRWQVMDQL